MASTRIDPHDVGRRFCDLVMKGGITSGIVFPKAVAELARQYRFRNIGGTSAGAIAAAATAAAEFRRATDADDPEYGFEKLGHLAAYLAERPDGRHSRLFGLFRPEQQTRRHYAILAAMLNRDTAAARIVRGVVATWRGFPLAALLGALPGVILLVALRGGGWIDVVAGIVAGFVVVLGAATASAFAAATSLAKALPQQEFGLARGHAADESVEQSPLLTDWLHTYLQDLAGRDLSHPLTFGDLDDVVLDESNGIVGINLQMMTTALSMGRPFSLPFRNDRFYFDPSELGRFFPKEVVAWMIAQPGDARNDARDQAMAALGYRPLPARSTLPVIVAVRLSLSFPILLAGVPLYRYGWESGVVDHVAAAHSEGDTVSHSRASEVDAARSAGQAPRFTRAGVRRVIFSDGGICSNFPVQMFDSVLPGWPTFGINLRDDLDEAGNEAQRAYLPPRGRSLPPEHYAIAQSGFAGVVSFAAAIIRTMQNWRDNLQRAAPGFRDRIVTVRHTKREGGLNLDMPARTITTMATSGALAAHALIDAFARPDDPRQDHFTYHRWIRVRSLLSVMQAVLHEIHDGVTVLENDPPYPDLLRDAPGYVGRSYQLSQQARNAAAQVLEALDRLDHELQEAGIDYDKGAPRPQVELRIQPVL